MTKEKAYRLLESMFSTIQEWAENQRQVFALCPKCGRNRYTGKPCYPDTRRHITNG